MSETPTYRQWTLQTSRDSLEQVMAWVFTELEAQPLDGLRLRIDQQDVIDVEALGIEPGHPLPPPEPDGYPTKVQFAVTMIGVAPPPKTPHPDHPSMRALADPHQEEPDESE